VTRAVPSEYAAWVRPIRPGYSFGLARRTGTLGLVVTDGAGEPLLLSSSHVMNQRPDGRRYALYQPGGPDGGDDGPIAVAVRYTRLSARRVNHSEGGLAALREGDCAVDAEHPLGRVTGVCTELRPGQRLVKVSRTTGLSHGRIVDVDWSGWVRLGRRRYPFERQILVASEDGSPVSLNGDSGAVWLTLDGQAAAMNFAACRNGMVSVCTPVARLLQKLAVQLPTQTEVLQWRARSRSASSSA
jgi:hypothetical protein